MFVPVARVEEASSNGDEGIVEFAKKERGVNLIENVWFADVELVEVVEQVYSGFLTPTFLRSHCRAHK